MRAVGGRARIKRIDDVIGLAEPERQPDHEIGADIADDVLRDRLGIGEQFRHQMRTRSTTGQPAALESDAEPPTAIAHLLSDIRL